MKVVRQRRERERYSTDPPADPNRPLHPTPGHETTRPNKRTWRNLGPMRGSDPMARATSDTSASVASHSAEMELMEETRCARKALATSLDSSEDQRFVVKIRSRGTQCAYTPTSFSMAARPSGVCSPPMSTRPGLCRSSMAVPSARNSGLERTCLWIVRWIVRRVVGFGFGC